MKRLLLLALGSVVVGVPIGRTLTSARASSCSEVQPFEKSDFEAAAGATNAAANDFWSAEASVSTVPVDDSFHVLFFAGTIEFRGVP